MSLEKDGSARQTDSDFLCRIEMLGSFTVRVAGRTFTRFRTQKTAALLAYLAFYQQRQHFREELSERFWPNGSPEAGRNSLKQELSALRRQLEPPGYRTGSILLADRATLAVQSLGVCTDVQAFHQLLRRAGHVCDPAERISLYRAAGDLYRGPLLPGQYQDWVVIERMRLEDAFIDSMLNLAHLLEAAGDLSGAIDAVLRAVSADALREEAHRELIRLRLAADQPAAAVEQYAVLERVLCAETGLAPEPETTALISGSLHMRHACSPGLTPRETCSLSGEPCNPVTHFVPPSTATEPILFLPVPLSATYGRDHEIAYIRRLLHPVSVRQTAYDCAPSPIPLPAPADRISRSSGCRVLTLTGPGGVGKTRLAVEAARQLRDDFGGALWYLSLADAASAESFVAALAGVLSLILTPGGNPMEQAAARLPAAPCLLVLDNFEQIVACAAPLLRELLERSENLRCLVTSRQPLGIDGERVLCVQPLAMPDDRITEPSDLLEYASVVLFLDLAQAARPDFQITPRNARTIAKLCRRLEGLPLAIELTAAWAQTLTPDQMLDRLQQRFELLVSRRHDLPPRHRTLRATLSGSMDQLSPSCLRLFARLSVFRGGWTLEEAEAVCTEGPVLAELATLVECSLVAREEARYHFLETVREFAAEKLSSEDRDSCSEAHAAYFLSLVRTAEPLLLGPQMPAWLQTLDHEIENLRAAKRWIRTQEDHGMEDLLLAVGLIRYWEVRGQFAEGREWLEAAIARCGHMPPCGALATALNGAGVLAYLQDDYTPARIRIEASLEMHRILAFPPSIGHALHCLGNIALRVGDFTLAHDRFSESIEVKRAVNDIRGVANSLHGLGDAEWSSGNFEPAVIHLAQSRALWSQLADPRAEPYLLASDGRMESRRGNYEQALEHFRTSLELRQKLNDRHGMAASLPDLGMAALQTGKREIAREALREGLRLADEIGARGLAAQCLEGLGAVALHDQFAVQGVSLLASAESIRASLCVPRPIWLEGAYSGLADEAKRQIGNAAFARAWQAGRRLSATEAIALAMAEKL